MSDQKDTKYSQEQETEFNEDDQNFGTNEDDQDFGTNEDDQDFGTNEDDQDFGTNEDDQNFGTNEDDQDFGTNDDDQDFGTNDDYQYNENSQQPSSSPIEFSISPTTEIPDYDTLFLSDLISCRALYIGFDFPETTGNTIKINIPTNILPLSVQVANNFYPEPILLECYFELNKHEPWQSIPNPYQLTNPIYNESFPGSILLKDRIHRFFSSEYHPQEKYRCQSYILAPQNIKNPTNIKELISTLTKEGFTEKQAEKSLQFCSYDINKARDYLITGIIETTVFELPLKYRDCPLFYLVLEICESFFDMCYSCCVCGENLGVYSLKPSCCNKQLCQHSYLNLGVGANIVNELKRDQFATDFLISLASIAYQAPQNPPVFDPSPESQGIAMSNDFFQKLPSIKEMCDKCNNDTELIDMIGMKNYEILRFLILANKAQLMTIPKRQMIPIKNFNGYQFLATFVSPESELLFSEKKKQFGVSWFWHGSRCDRWYRILHTGLKDMGRTSYVLNGGPGDGIYMSDSYCVSLSYSGNAFKNCYTNSKLKNDISVISLIENANVPEFNGQVAPNEFTQQDEEACITRVLLVNVYKSEIESNNCIDYNFYNSDFNTLQTPPMVPTLRDLLNEKMKVYH